MDPLIAELISVNRYDFNFMYIQYRSNVWNPRKKYFSFELSKCSSRLTARRSCVEPWNGTVRVYLPFIF